MKSRKSFSKMTARMNTKEQRMNLMPVKKGEIITAFMKMGTNEIN